MDVLGLLALIIIVGVLLWAANTYIPMQDPIKSILNGVVVVVLLLMVIFWFLRAFGIVLPNFGVNR